MSPMPDEYLTTVQAAAYLKLSPQFLEIARYKGDGSGPEYIKLARSVRYRRSALDAFMDAHHKSGEEPTPERRRMPPDRVPVKSRGKTQRERATAAETTTS
jgi:hypothetical protein